MQDLTVKQDQKLEHGKVCGHTLKCSFECADVTRCEWVLVWRSESWDAQTASYSAACKRQRWIQPPVLDEDCSAPGSEDSLELGRTCLDVDVVQDEAAEDQIKGVVAQTRFLERSNPSAELTLHRPVESCRSAAYNVNHAGTQIEGGHVRAFAQKMHGQVALAAAGIKDSAPAHTSREPQEREVELANGRRLIQFGRIQLPSQSIVKSSLTAPDRVLLGSRCRVCAVVH